MTFIRDRRPRDQLRLRVGGVPRVGRLGLQRRLRLLRQRHQLRDRGEATERPSRSRSTPSTTSGTPDLRRQPLGSDAYDTQFDGFTQVLTCFADVTPGVPNTLKLAIADTTDRDPRLGGVPRVVRRHVDAEDEVLAAHLRRCVPSTAAPPAPMPARQGGWRLVGHDADGRPGRRARRRRVGGPQRHRRQGRGRRLRHGVPEHEPLPTASNVNYRAGGADPNLVVAKLGTNGAIKVFTDQTSNVIVDVFGYFCDDRCERLHPRHPDSRDRHPQRCQAGQGWRRHVPGRRRRGVPAGVTSVALNLTIDQPPTRWLRHRLRLRGGDARHLERQRRRR